jgi:putative transposase
MNLNNWKGDDLMDEIGIVSLPDDKSVREEQIIAMLKYTAIYDALHNDEISVHEALKRASMKKYIHPSTGKEYNFSIRTLYRYLKNYKAFKMEGLKRNTHKNKGRPKVIPIDLCEKIFSLKLQLPIRSARKIITLLELSGEVEKGFMKERTVSRLLKENGYTRKTLRQIKQHYKKIHVDKIYDLFVSDIKEFWIKDEHDTTHKIYLFIIIDYYSRRIMHAQFYSDGILLRLEDCLKKAIVKFGLCAKFYVDNGSVYIANNFKFACASIGIKLIYASVYWPQGKGVVERFIKSCNEDFLAELRINPIRDIRKLNEALFGWIEGEYHKSSHEGLDGLTPLEAWENSLRTGITPKYVPPIELANAFYHHVERKVDTYGVISFETNTYEVDVALIGERVLVRYDPLDLRALYIYHKNKFVCVAKPIDLTREQHSQYKNVKRNYEFEPRINIDYPRLMAEHHQKMIQNISEELMKGNHRITFDTADIQETYAAEEADEELARPGFTIREKEGDMTKKEYFDVMIDFLNQKSLTYHQKELLYQYYKDFKIFSKMLFEKTLDNLKNKFPDTNDNLLFYLNVIKEELDKD